jgi:antitoxin (DNA-binding transcriptional repressor) of toxin-antitoxin stability system
LAVVDEVQSKRESVLVTKRGKPVAKLVPVEKNLDDIFNFMKGKGSIVGDVVSPAFSPEECGNLFWSCLTLTLSYGWRLTLLVCLRKPKPP